jgi:hypothetical protein
VLRSRAGFAAAAAFAAVAIGCAAPPIGPAGRPIHARGTWVQPASGATFPERIGALPRTDATAWDADETNVGVSYGDGANVRITLYVYPAGDPRTGRLRAEFLETETSLAEIHPAALRESSAIVRAPVPDGLAVGFEARFRLLASEGEHGTLAQVFQCGRWFLKVRATYAGAYSIDDALAAVHEQVRCRDIALGAPIGTKRNIDYDPAGGAEWLVYGATQLVWLKEHVAPEELAFGIPDHEPGLFVESFAAMLDARDKAEANGGAEPNAFLDRMREIRAAGFLEAYVWKTQLGFLPAPSALAPQLEAFESWRERALPAHRHEVHAGVRLSD